MWQRHEVYLDGRQIGAIAAKGVSVEAALTMWLYLHPRYEARKADLRLEAVA